MQSLSSPGSVLTQPGFTPPVDPLVLAVTSIGLAALAWGGVWSVSSSSGSISNAQR